MPVPTFRADPTDVWTSVEERREIGRARRRTVPRSSHAELPTPPDRPDPVALLEEQHRTRLADLVPVRVGRMAQSPYAFLRGSAVVMSEDLSNTPTTGLTVQACGDAHVANFGGFATPERLDVFDLNDFDETLVGPWEWDVKRLAASAVVALSETDQPVTPDDARLVARAAVRQYRDAMARFATAPVLETWYRQLEIERVIPHLSPAAQRVADEAIAKMRRRTALRQLPKLTELTGEGRRLVERPPLITSVGFTDDQRDEVRAFVTAYIASLPPERRTLLEHFQPVDVARKVVGVGSVGTRCFVVLLLTPEDEPLFLQVKEAPPSVLERHCGPFEGSGGERVVHGQRSIQAASDILLGWTSGFGHDFYVRQLRDRKYSFDLTGLSPVGMETYVRVCATTLARAHARTGDAAAISGYLGTGDVFPDAAAEWARRYADRTRADHAELVAAIADGRIEALHDV